MRIPIHFSLIVVLALGAGACAQAPSSHVRVDYRNFVGVAGISGDRDLARRLTEVLAAAGIPSIIEGSIVYGISVPPENRAQTVELLKKDAETHKYWIEFQP